MKQQHPQSRHLNRLLLFLLLLVLVLVSCAQRPTRRNMSGQAIDPISERVVQSEGMKKKMAILSFFNESPNGGDDLATTVAEELRQELARTGQFIVDPSLARIFSTSREVYSGGGMQLAQLAARAKNEGINLVLFGRIIATRIRQNSDEIGLMRRMSSEIDCQIEVKLFDTSTAKELSSDLYDSTTSDQSYNFYLADAKERLEYKRELLRYAAQVTARKAVPRLVDLAERMDWSGRVAKIVGQNIYINAGREAGIQIGDILKVMTQGREIFDPETGALIGVTKGEMKGTIEVIDYFGPDGAMATLHSGGSITEGDFVQLY